jgi:hypothetical protein
VGAETHVPTVTDLLRSSSIPAVGSEVALNLELLYAHRLAHRLKKDNRILGQGRSPDIRKHGAFRSDRNSLIRRVKKDYSCIMDAQQFQIRNSVILLANLAKGLINDRMAHLGLKSQANSLNPLKQVKSLNDGHCRYSIAILRISNLL